MKKHPTTRKDIAKELGVSPSTVSRALKDHPDISPATKKKVNELAVSLNYKPNPIALSLRSNVTNTIGLIIPEIVHHFFSSVISGIEDLAFDNGFNVLISQSNESYYREVSSAETMLNSRVGGVLASISKTTYDLSHFENLINNDIPIVFFDRYSDDLEADAVFIDDRKGAYMAVNHLISAGCKKIAHYAGPGNLIIGQNRLNGYLDALKDNDIEPVNELIIDCDSYQQALMETPKMLKKFPDIDGIFAVNDLTAIGAIESLKKLNKNIPDEVAVAGFTNSLISSLTDPKLTTVDQQAFEMGRIAFQMLYDRICNTEKIPTRKKELKTSLIIRQSTKK